MGKAKKRRSSDEPGSSQGSDTRSILPGDVKNKTYSKYFKAEETQRSVPPDEVLSSDNKSSICTKVVSPNRTDMGMSKLTGSPSSQQGGKRLMFTFFDKPCTDLAKMLLGKMIVRKLHTGEVLSGKIVETEAYLGGEDKAAHSYGGKKTNRNAAMFMVPGTVYVYHIYGMYTCINVSSRGDGAAVLLRAIQPISGLPTMRKARSLKRKDSGKNLREHDITNGPSKLTQALHITKPDADQKDMTTCPYLWLEKSDCDITEEDIVSTSRIGVDYAGDWAKKPLRFYIRGNNHVSVRDKIAEEKWEYETPPPSRSRLSESRIKSNIPSSASPDSSILKAKKNSDKLEIKESSPGIARMSSESVTESQQSTLSLSDLTEEQPSTSTSTSKAVGTHGTLNTCLGANFYNNEGVQLAQALLGQVLVRILPDGTRLAGRIVEAEAYLGVADGSCHCYGGKKTERNAAMFMPPGTAYVYNVYYKYCCFNISCKEEGAVVLVRSVEPTEGQSRMRQLRGANLKDNGASLKNHQLCSGPSKLCMAMDINKEWANMTDLSSSPDIWIETGSNVNKENIVTCTRIGLENTPKEFATKLWRFYEKGNKSVSVADKTAEKAM